MSQVISLDLLGWHYICCLGELYTLITNNGTKIKVNPEKNIRMNHNYVAIKLLRKKSIIF